MKKLGISIILFSIILIVFYNCNTGNENHFQNVENPKAEYVGMNTCKNCHQAVYDSFIKTGMGQSWGLATQQKSAADFSVHKALVYDSIKDFYYKPYWDGDSLTILEYRIKGKDTVHKRIEKVSFIVGSGQHTNSHIINNHGYLTQAPITFYTQKGTWDLAPGFEAGHNSRFDRKIELECISCHNGYPEFVSNSLNKYTNVPLGIDCERCHGPGSLHVEEKLKGILVDTSKEPDYTIVNPRRLTTEQQNNLCQRCHLQGITVLNDDKSFFDFYPSQSLSQTMNTFLPNYSGSDNHMIMASHVERMKMSNCYIASQKMSCITCHNPHISVKSTSIEHFNASCRNCHTTQNQCTESLEIRNQANNNCTSCHMPKNKSIDIPHVAVTDHYIRKRPLSSNDEEVSRFINMICYNNNLVELKTRSRAFIEFYERYEPMPLFLDSAIIYLQQSGIDTSQQFDKDLIRIYFLKSNFKKIIQLAQNTKPQSINDSWTAYRIGESFMKENKILNAIPFLKQATELKKLALDFQYKLAHAYLLSQQLNEAKLIYEFILNEYPKHADANADLGYIYMQIQNFLKAKKIFKICDLPRS
ncbi:MAG: hypothetical protein UZ11_BCD004001460 [Bacteroidetes bacterium OLB11]|nr:MAG: hypothetical protein UZ11_BCD004001460 [Bacteroidetes bacterium OLB11]